MFKIIQSQFAWKIFFSYLIVILAGMLVLGASVELVLPTAFDQHMTNMENMTGNQMVGDMMSGQPVDLEVDLFSSFRTTINQALIRSVSAAIIVAVVVSILVSYRVVNPVREMMIASQFIAEGNYQERVYVPGDPLRADELAQLAISFNRMAEILDQNEIVRQRLVGDISHELRTPLTVIKGSLEGLIDDVLPDDPETYQKIYNEADKLSHLVDDLQHLSRAEAGSYELDKKYVQVKDLINTAVDSLSQQFEEKGVLLGVEIPTGIPQMHLDPHRIGQVLLNIIGNALQYSSKGDRVVVRGQVVGEEVHFQILDTGIGISLEHHPHIFTRFYRVEKSRSRSSGGSGIGLTIAKHFIEAHGGRIWMESEGKGKGSTFTFSLPISI